MTATEIIADCERRGLRLWREGGRVRYAVRRGELGEGEKRRLAEVAPRLLPELPDCKRVCSREEVEAEVAAALEPFASLIDAAQRNALPPANWFLPAFTSPEPGRNYGAPCNDANGAARDFAGAVADAIRRGDRPAVSRNLELLESVWYAVGEDKNMGPWVAPQSTDLTDYTDYCAAVQSPVSRIANAGEYVEYDGQNYVRNGVNDVEEREEG